MKGTFSVKKLIGAALAAGMTCTALGGFGTLTASAIKDLNDNEYIPLADGTAALAKGNPGATDVTVPGEIRTDAGDMVPVTAIAPNAFARSTALRSIAFPGSVTSIGPMAFYACTSLTSVKFARDSKLKEFGGNAFYGCTALRSIAIPGPVETIGPGTFCNCTKLASVIYEDGSKLKRIAAGAFDGCTSLQHIKITENVEEIGICAFAGCTALQSVSLRCGTGKPPAFGRGAFKGCSDLRCIDVCGEVVLDLTDAFKSGNSLEFTLIFKLAKNSDDYCKCFCTLANYPKLSGVFINTGLSEQEKDDKFAQVRQRMDALKFDEDAHDWFNSLELCDLQYTDRRQESESFQGNERATVKCCGHGAFLPF